MYRRTIEVKSHCQFTRYGQRKHLGNVICMDMALLQTHLTKSHYETVPYSIQHLVTQCRRKTFMVHQTFVWWAIYIPYKFVKSPIRHLGLAIGNVRRVRRFSPTLCNRNVHICAHWCKKVIEYLTHELWDLIYGCTVSIPVFNLESFFYYHFLLCWFIH